MKFTLVLASLFLPLGAEPLFNGKNLDQFIVDTPGVWSVQNGVIVGKHAGLKYNDFLQTKKHYSNFVLRLQFQLVNGDGNSGVQFRSKPVPGSHEVSGYQADIGQQYWGSLYDESRRNKTLAGPKPDQLTQLDRKGWNEYLIIARGDHIMIELNGIRTVDYTEAEPGIDQDGFIALQVHSGPAIEVRFKDLNIRELR
jgi:hypothetical protein